MPNSFLVLPRPGTVQTTTTPAIQAPSEAIWTSTFGTHLPPATYLQTPHGRAAYYSLPPTSSPATGSPHPISRVFFIHGVQTPALGLQPIATELKRRFPHAHFVLVDVWGHGLSDTPIAPYDPAFFHRLILDLMAELGWDDAHFFGYSFGGSTVTTFAASYPSRVSSLVLVAPAGLLTAAAFDETERKYLEGGEGLEEGAWEFVLEFLEGGKLIVPGDWEERVGRGEIVAPALRDWQVREHAGHKASVVAIFRDGGVLDQHAAFAEVAKLDIPKLAVLGELDDVCSPEWLQKVGIDNFTVVLQAGHDLVRVRVPEVAQLIESFWHKL